MPWNSKKRCLKRRYRFCWDIDAGAVQGFSPDAASQDSRSVRHPIRWPGPAPTKPSFSLGQGCIELLDSPLLSLPAPQSLVLIRRNAIVVRYASAARLTVSLLEAKI